MKTEFSMGLMIFALIAIIYNQEIRIKKLMEYQINDKQLIDKFAGWNGAGYSFLSDTSVSERYNKIITSKFQKK
ncbi:MAG: hypothetical protein ACHQ1D_00090 [Nitrososphaerales archaeon]